MPQPVVREGAVRAETPGAGPGGRLHPAGARTAWATRSRWRICAPASAAPASGSDARDQETAARGPEDPDAGPVELRGAVRAGHALVRAHPVSRHALAAQRHRGRALRPLPERRRHADVLRDLHRLRRQADPAAVDGDAGLPALQVHHAERPGRAEQRHGALPAQDQRPLRHARPPGQREHLPDVLRQRPLLERPRSCSSKPQFPVGIHPARQLRLADRDRGRLAGAQPRRRPDAEVLHRRVPARSRRSDARCIGRLREPLLKPNENEREGYVPNVVYTCGSLLHGRRLIIPYAMSDYATSFATVPLDDVLAAME